MAVRSVAWSSGRGPTSIVRNPDRRDFSGNLENTPLMTASCLTDLNTNQDKNDETCNSEIFVDDSFAA